MTSTGTVLRVGAHTSVGGGYHRALERGAEAGCDIVQIFASPNQQWAAPELTDEVVARWEEARRATGVDPAMAHGPYLVNLGAPAGLVRERSLAALARDYTRCATLGIRYLVLHPGAHVGDGEATGIARIAEALDRLHDAQPDNRTMVLLENTAGQGSCLGRRFEELRDLFGAVRAPERLGICIDTCHLLAAGYDVTTDAGWGETFAALERTVGCRHVRAFHVNDSKRALGARVDRHEHLGRGFLGLGAFRRLVNDARFAGLPMVIETPKPSDDADRVNISILRSLHGRSRVGRVARRLAAEPLPSHR